MASRLEIMQELDRRGKLPEDVRPYYDEAVKRGLVGKRNPFEMTPEQRDPTNVTQALSGVNEGIANILGAPVDLTNAALAAGPAISNTLFGTDFQAPQVDSVLGLRGSADHKRTFEQLGVIKPVSEDPDQQFMRRVGEEVGGGILPGISIASRVAKPMAMLGREGAALIGSGVGAATAEQVAPGNAMAETAGQIIGGLSPSALLGTVRRATATKAAPTLEALRAQKDAAYAAVDAAGAVYRPEAYKRLMDNIVNEAAAQHISTTRHGAVFDFIADIDTRHPGGLTLTELDQIRQEVRRDLMGKDGAERHFGDLILDEIDDFINTASPADMKAGSASQANELILAARELNTRFRKTELIDDAIERAHRRAASTGAGGNLNNALRQNIRAILDNPKKRRSFTFAELSEMEKVVRQGKGEDLLRLVGQLSPTSGGLMAALHTGAILTNPAVAGGSALAAGAKYAADHGTINKTMTLRALIARGSPSPPVFSPTDRQALSALTVGQAANQNDPLPYNALRMTALN